MHTTTSRDGTTIAYDREGDGDPLILVPGALPQAVPAAMQDHGEDED